MSRVASLLGRGITSLMLVASGGYLVVYLYRWEWNRALVAASFFLATEVALLGSLLLRRLGSIDRRLGSLEARSTLAEIRESAPPHAPVFRWLDDRGSRLQVFVPVLLGAGVIMSVLASGIERLAGITTRPVLERRLARRLGGLQLPAGGLLAPAVASPVARSVHPRGWARAAAGAFSVLAVVVLAVSAVEVVADATQDRPDPHVDGRSELLVAVDVRFTDTGRTRTAEALLVACRHTIGHGHDLDIVATGDERLVRLTVFPALGEHATRRFVGCLEDAQFDRVLADVLSVRRVP